MHRLSLAAIVLLALQPAAAAAASSLATATSVESGVTSQTTFAIQSAVTLPNQCYTAHVRTATLAMSGHRSFVVEQTPPASSCAQKTAYNCTVSGTFNLPITHKFEVDTKGRKWEVLLSTEAPSPMQPMCRKK
jgi:hypothetical protein